MLEQVEQLLADLRSMWRFRTGAIVVAWVLCVLGWIAVFIVPPRYEASTRIYLDTNSLLRPLLQGLAVPPNTVNQVEMVRGALLARPHLETVIDQTDLKKRVHDASKRDLMVKHLAKTILIQSEGRGQENSDRVPTFYTITFRDSDPKVAMAVVESLLASFVSESLGANAESTETAQKFLSEQLKDYDQKLSSSERELAEFKRQNLGAMPDERGGYFTRLQAEMTELDRIRSQRSVALVRREDLRAKLVGGSASDSPNSTATASLETSVDAPLAAARAKLDDLLLRFTEKHPDVIAARGTISQLEAQRKAEIEAMRSNRGALGTPHGATSLVAQNLQIALNQAETEVAALQSQILERQSRIAELRRSINTVPEVEAELARLTRNYNVNKVQYDAILQRLESARISGQADKTEERKIRVLEPPRLPTKPVTLNIWVLLGLVLLAGVAGGIGYALIKARIAPVFSRARQLEHVLKLPVLGAIDRIAPEGGTGTGGALNGFSFLAGLLLATFVVALVFSESGLRIGALVRGVLLA